MNTDSDDMTNDLTRRLDRLERSNRRWRRACMAGLLAASTMVFVGWKGEKTVVGESIVLKKGGAVRAMFSVTKKGTVALSMMNGEGKTRAILSVSDEGIPKLSYVWNKGKSVRITLSGTESGNLGLILNNSKGEERVGLRVMQDGGGSFTLKDAVGRSKK